MSTERKPLHSYVGPKYWPAWLGLGCLRLICMLPHRSRMAVGRFLGRVAHRFGAERRAIVRRNIELSFPALTTTERDALAREHFEALGMSAIELGIGRWASDEEISAMCSIENVENITKPLDAGQGVIVLSAHFTTIDVIARMFGPTNIKFAAVYRRNRSPFTTELLRSGRERSGATTIEKRDVKLTVRWLRNGDAVWYAPDQSYKRKGAVVVPFFGVPTMHTTATSTLARLGKAAVVPFFPRRMPDGSYTVKIGKPLENFPSDDPVADTLQYIHLLEEHIRECPEQYYWIHRKFKDLPPEYEDYYADLDAAK